MSGGDGTTNDSNTYHDATEQRAKLRRYESIHIHEIPDVKIVVVVIVICVSCSLQLCSLSLERCVFEECCSSEIIHQLLLPLILLNWNETM